MLGVITMQSGLFLVTVRKIWSALVFRVAVVPLTDRVSAPVSRANASRSALPAFDTSEVLPLVLPLAPDCLSGLCTIPAGSPVNAEAAASTVIKFLPAGRMIGRGTGKP